MFEKLFSYPRVLRRHREGPLAEERAKYLEALAAQGMAPGTILHRASYCLCIANELQQWPQDHCFEEEDIEIIASKWAANRVETGHASCTRWPTENFRLAATEFLHTIGRLRSPPLPAPSRYEDDLAEFVSAQRKKAWLSEATRRSAMWQVRKFLDYLDRRGVVLEDVTAQDIDAYFQHMAQRWSRNSLRSSAKMLRAWFAYCHSRDLVRRELTAAILFPRIYRHEGLPLGPTWEEVSRMLAETSGNDPAQLRDQAILLLLSVYGLRSGEVRRLLLDDIDWPREQIRIVRSKTGREETLPLEPSVGNAIARYLRHGRPKSKCRFVFLTLRGPHRPLSGGGLYHIVESQLSKVSKLKKGRGPHALRHACARHLLEAGRNFKEIGDYLGHRNPDATRYYAKVELASLRRVAFDDLGGLA